MLRLRSKTAAFEEVVLELEWSLRSPAAPYYVIPQHLRGARPLVRLIFDKDKRPFSVWQFQDLVPSVATAPYELDQDLPSSAVAQVDWRPGPGSPGAQLGVAWTFEDA
jgi:hypothetical protein